MTTPVHCHVREKDQLSLTRAYSVGTGVVTWSHERERSVEREPKKPRPWAGEPNRDTYCAAIATWHPYHPDGGT